MRLSSVLSVVFIATLIDQVFSACNSTFPYTYGSSCLRECPWNVTLITYLSNSSTTCLTSTTFDMQIAPMGPMQMIPVKDVSLPVLPHRSGPTTIRPTIDVYKIARLILWNLLMRPTHAYLTVLHLLLEINYQGFAWMFANWTHSTWFIIQPDSVWINAIQISMLIYHVSVLLLPVVRVLLSHILEMIALACA